MSTESGLTSSPVMSIDKAWVDYNGHLNQAYYGVLFDRALDHALLPAGLGPDYIRERNHSFMTVECHTCFVRELMHTEKIRILSRIVDLDDKRMHMFCELQHASEGWLSATAEFMFLHVSMETRRTAPWPADIRVKLDAIRDLSSGLPVPERVGRRIGIPRR